MAATLTIPALEGVTGMTMALYSRRSVSRWYLRGIFVPYVGSFVQCAVCMKEAYRIKRTRFVDCLRYVVGQVPYACPGCGNRFHLSQEQEALFAVKKSIEPRDRQVAGQPIERKPRLHRIPTRSVMYLASEFDGEAIGGRVQGAGYTADVSPGGCRIESDMPVQMGMRLAVLFTVSEHEAPIRIAAARVRWAQKYAFGVEFIRITPPDESRLTEFLGESII